jgi:hypothetical protein
MGHQSELGSALSQIIEHDILFANARCARLSLRNVECGMLTLCREDPSVDALYSCDCVLDCKLPSIVLVLLCSSAARGEF